MSVSQDEDETYMALGQRKKSRQHKPFVTADSLPTPDGQFSTLSSMSFSLTKASIDGARKPVLPFAVPAVIVLVFHRFFTFACY